jgi:hypothetical protein
MNREPKLGLVSSLVVAACGCLANVPPPSVKAAHVERIQCETAADPGADAHLLASARVVSFEPVYSHFLSGRNNSEDRVTGAKLLLRPPDGFTAEKMTRVLQCHSARALLGQVDAGVVANDPYWLPGAWLDIDVVPEQGNFAVTLHAAEIRDNLLVLARAEAFARAHRIY